MFELLHIVLLAVLQVFEAFYLMSALHLNPRKTELFCGGLSRDVVLEFARLSSFEIGKLPVRSLGVPLISGRLLDRDCKPLIAKITCHLEAWGC